MSAVVRGGTRASDQVYAALVEAIRELRLPPGAPLSESELAQQLQVSRTPVREALARLVDAGLVRVVPQVGTRVARIKQSEVCDAQFVREHLEIAALRAACARRDRDVTELRTALRRQRAARAAGDVEAFFTADEQLHAAIFALAGHAGVWPLVVRGKVQLDRVRRLSRTDRSVMAELLAEHEQIVTAIADGTAAAGAPVLRQHARRVLTLQPALQQRHPDYFELAPG